MQSPSRRINAAVASKTSGQPEPRATLELQIVNYQPVKSSFATGFCVFDVRSIKRQITRSLKG